MTDSVRLRNAKGLYLEGIRDGKMREALDKYTGARYTQHSTGVADGKEGFIEFFTPFLERNPDRDIRIIRAIEDGRYVFCHAYQSLNGGAAQWVTADLFDTDESGRIIEHWDVIAEYVSPTASGRNMVDGPTEVTDFERTDDNKTIVGAFFETVLLGGQADRAADFISSEQYDQHSPAVGDGLDGFEKHIAQVARSGEPMRYVNLHRLIGQGNFVVGFSEVQMLGGDWAVFDIFRLEAGKIVEHWDVQEKILPKAQWNNSGKF